MNMKETNLGRVGPFYVWTEAQLETFEAYSLDFTTASRLGNIVAKSVLRQRGGEMCLGDI